MSETKPGFIEKRLKQQLHQQEKDLKIQAAEIIKLKTETNKKNMYELKDIEKIASFKTWDDKKKIDELLRIDAQIYAHQGSDSTKAEIEEGKRNSRKIYRAIKEIDHDLGTSFLNLMDK